MLQRVETHVHRLENPVVLRMKSFLLTRTLGSSPPFCSRLSRAKWDRAGPSVAVHFFAYYLCSTYLLRGSLSVHTPPPLSNSGWHAFWTSVERQPVFRFRRFLFAAPARHILLFLFLTDSPQFIDSQRSVDRKESTKGVFRMVAGLSRKHDRAIHQYHMKNSGTSKGVAMDSRRRRSNGGIDDQRAILPPSCLPERRYIVLPHIFPHDDDNSVDSGISELSDPVDQQAGVIRILESFSYLCVGGETSSSSSKESYPRKDRRRLSSPGPRQAQVVYPIASYPGRLNSKKLIEQRRQSLQHHFFRPVQSAH